MKHPLFLNATLFFLVCNTLAAQVTFSSSNLPIVVIKTDCGSYNCIPDEPKIGGTMKIIERKNGERNYLTDIDNPAYLNYSGNIAMERRGSTSQWFFDKPSYGFITITSSIGSAKTNQKLLGMPAEHDWTLGNLAYDPTLMHDFLTFQLSNELGLYAPRERYCELVIDGTYRGLYLLGEKIKRDKNRVDVTELLPTDNAEPAISGGYITKADKNTGGDPVAFSMPSYNGSTDYIHHYPKPDAITFLQGLYIQKQFLDLASKSTNSNVKTGYPSIINTESFIDYMLICELGGSVDGYQFSTFFNKDRGGKLNAGPVWDFNLAYGLDFGAPSARSGFNQWQFDNGDNTGSKFWRNLYKETNFGCAFKEKWQALRQPKQLFDTKVIFEKIDSTAQWIDEAAQREQALFNSFNNYPNQITELKDWIIKHVEWIDQQIVSEHPTCNLPALPNLVINEIMYYPQSKKTAERSDPYEFIELKNASATEAINLAGVYFNQGILYAFPNTAVLQPNALLVLAADATVFKERYGFAPFGQYFKNLDNSGEVLSLTDAYGRSIDEVHYKAKKPWAAADSTGYSLELISPQLDNTLASSWIASKKTHGTPGENTITAIENSENTTAAPFNLSIHPNPLTTNSALHYTLNDAQSVEITLFDINGRQLHEIQAKVLQNEGKYNYSLRFMETMPTGIYVLKVRTGEQVLVLKAIKE